MTLSTNQLREVTSVLLRYLEENDAATVDIPFDYYWDISPPELYDSTDQAPRLGLGQVSDDWEYLKRMASDGDDLLTYGLVWVGSVLRVIGDAIVPAPDNGPEETYGLVVSTTELRESAELLFEHLEGKEGTALRIPVDHYWDIARPDRYNPLENPAPLTRGRVSDDWAELKRLVPGDAEPGAMDLARLASVLRAIGETVVT